MPFLKLFSGKNKERQEVEERLNRFKDDLEPVVLVFGSSENTDDNVERRVRLAEKVHSDTGEIVLYQSSPPIDEELAAQPLRVAFEEEAEISGRVQRITYAFPVELGSYDNASIALKPKSYKLQYYGDPFKVKIRNFHRANIQATALHVAKHAQPELAYISAREAGLWFEGGSKREKGETIILHLRYKAEEILRDEQAEKDRRNRARESLSDMVIDPGKQYEVRCKVLADQEKNKPVRVGYESVVDLSRGERVRDMGRVFSEIINGLQRKTKEKQDAEGR